jgi:hypothetical protein
LARYVPQTWVDLAIGGTPTSAARFNFMEAGLKNVDYRAAARVTHNAAQSITNNVATVLAFNTERYDQENNASSTIHDNVTNNSRLTCRTAGIYEIKGNVEWAGNTAGSRSLVIRLNGGTNIGVAAVTPVVSAAYQQIVSTAYQLAVNDYVELLATQNSGGALNVNATGNYSPEFMMHLVA